MKKQVGYLILLLTLLSCKNEKQQPKQPENRFTDKLQKLSVNRPNLNISLLLDLSDRIDPDKYPNPSMEYYERDLGYINSIVESFEIHLRNKRTITINDHIQMYLDPEPSDKNLNQKMERLNLSFNKDNASKRNIIGISQTYDSIVRLIYESAIKEKEYIGSDIWRFFKTKVKDFCIEDNHRNILIILTDGYVFHENTKIKEANQTSYLIPQTIRDYSLNNSNWKARMEQNKFGFINATDGLEKLEILVLGIHPDSRNPYEEDVINYYWSNWLQRMGVKNFEIKTAHLPAAMDQIIKDFILNNS